MATQWGVRYERLDRDEWTPLTQEWETRRDAAMHIERLNASPDIWRRVRLVRRAVGPWENAD